MNLDENITEFAEFETIRTGDMVILLDGELGNPNEFEPWVVESAPQADCPNPEDVFSIHPLGNSSCVFSTKRLKLSKITTFNPFHKRVTWNDKECLLVAIDGEEGKVILYDGKGTDTEHVLPNEVFNLD